MMTLADKTSLLLWPLSFGIIGINKTAEMPPSPLQAYYILSTLIIFHLEDQDIDSVSWRIPDNLQAC